MLKKHRYYMEKRIISVANYIIESKSTIRKTAKVFGVSKSTIHKDVTERLLEINPRLATRVKKVLEYNHSMMSVRGGNALRLKYKKKMIGNSQSSKIN